MYRKSEDDSSTANVMIKKMDMLRTEWYNPELTLKVISENPGLLVAILDGMNGVVDHIQMTVVLSKLIWCYPTAER